jgi:ribosome-binding factor A
MTSRRVLKAAEAIREVVSVRDVTVTYVELAPDMRSAKVHVSIMGDETRQNLSLRGLQNAAGYLQQKIIDRIDTRYTPRLSFVLDQGVKHSLEVARILKEVLPPPVPPENDPNAEGDEIEPGAEHRSSPGGDSED